MFINHILLIDYDACGAINSAIYARIAKSRFKSPNSLGDETCLRHTASVAAMAKSDRMELNLVSMKKKKLCTTPLPRCSSLFIIFLDLWWLLS